MEVSLGKRGFGKRQETSFVFSGWTRWNVLTSFVFRFVSAVTHRSISSRSRDLNLFLVFC